MSDKDHQWRSPMSISEQRKILLDSTTNYATMLGMFGMCTMRLRIMDVPLGFLTLKWARGGVKIVQTGSACTNADNVKSTDIYDRWNFYRCNSAKYIRQKEILEPRKRLTQPYGEVKPPQRSRKRKIEESPSSYSWKDTVLSTIVCKYTKDST